MYVRTGYVAAVFVLLTLLFAPSAHAQSAITGVVKDTSGAVLPGVTVEAASDVLIERTRSAVTDGSGAYRIVDLRPGTYVVTFTLPGFQTTKREGLELPANFTSTVNADLTVGSLEESISVTGASPVVDVNTNQTTQVLPRDVLDAVPSARTIQSLGQLVVGVALSSPDVGGSRAMQQTYFAVHGVGASGTMVMVDGLITNGTMGDGAVQAYHNEAMIQEAVYQTAGGSAETITGGLNMNLVPKDGGNRFAGGARYAKSPSSWQGDNLSDGLKALGVTGVDRISNFFEYNLEQGGPIMRDRLWFYGAFRHARYDKPIANTFVVPKSNLPYPQAYENCRRAGNCEQGISDEKMDNPIARLTWQVSPKNKFAVFNDRAMRLRGHAMGSLTDPDTASFVWHTPTFATGSAKWTSTVTSRLLLEGGVSFNRERYDTLFQDGIFAERNTPAWYANVRKTDSATFTWNAPGLQLGNYPDRYNVAASASYITGSHTVKVGFQDSFGPYRRYNNTNADLYQTYNNVTSADGIVTLTPQTVQVYNTPLEVAEYLDANLGVYAQDSWRLNKFTFNYGLRFDHVKQHVEGQDRQIGRFAASEPYEDFALPVWNDVSPRTSVVYDVFGDGKTAIRGGFNKYVTAATTGFAQLYNPTASTSQSLTWDDLDKDDIADGERGCTFRVNGCEIDFRNLPANFGVRSLSKFDEDLQRPYQLAYNLGVSHEIAPGVALTAEWFHSRFGDIIVRNNVARTTTDYTKVTVINPLDGSPIDVYNVNPDKRNAVQNVDSNDPDVKRTYNGLEINFNARLPKGARIFGGTSTERTLTNICSAAGSDPNFLAYCDQSKSGIPFQTSVKLAGTYPLPWYDIQVSGSYQGLAGANLGTEALPYGVFTAGTGFTTPNGSSTVWAVNSSTVYTATTCKSANCTIGAPVIPGGLNQTSLNVPLTAPQSEYAPRLNQVDFAVNKTFTVRTMKIQPKLDLFNAFNSDDYTGVNSMQLYTTSSNANSTYKRPSTVLQGRIIRIGVDVKW